MSIQADENNRLVFATMFVQKIEIVGPDLRIVVRQYHQLEPVRQGVEEGGIVQEELRDSVRESQVPFDQLRRSRYLRLSHSS